MTEKNIIYSLKGGETPPSTIIPLYWTPNGAKILSLRGELWTPGFPPIPYPVIDLESTQDEQNAVILKNEFDNAQIILYLFIRDLTTWHLVRFFPVVSRGAQQSPDLLMPLRNSFRYFSLQKGYCLGIFLRFPQRDLSIYEHISIVGDVEESVLPEDDSIGDMHIPVPETPPVPPLPPSSDDR